jgi:hypothetical protein
MQCTIVKQNETMTNRNMKKSLIIAFHNGAKYLKYSLPVLRNCEIDELVCVFDKVDAELITEFFAHIPVEVMDKLKIIENHEQTWQHIRAEVFQKALSKASGDILYVSAEDIKLDPRNFNDDFWFNSNVGFVDFRYTEYDPTSIGLRSCWEIILTKILDKLLTRKATQRSGIFAVRKQIFDKIGLEDVPTEEDWFRRRVKEHGYKHVHVIAHKNHHMRPCHSKDRQLLQGASRYRQGYSLSKVIGHVLLHFKPLVLTGYIKEKRRR